MSFADSFAFSGQASLQDTAKPLPNTVFCSIWMEDCAPPPPPRRAPKWRIGHTPKGAYSPRGRCSHLLETPFSAPLLRTLLRTLFIVKSIEKGPLMGISEPFCQERKSTPNSKFWGRISRGRPRRYPGGHPGAKTSVRPSRSWKTKHLGADIHDPKARTSITPGVLKTFGRKNFGLNFRSYSENPSPEPFLERCVAVRPLSRDRTIQKGSFRWRNL